MSAVEKTGLDAAWAAMQTLAEWRQQTGVWAETRAAQARYWFTDEVRQGLLHMLETDTKTAQHMAKAEADVSAGRVSPAAAASAVLQAFRQD